MMPMKKLQQQTNRPLAAEFKQADTNTPNAALQADIAPTAPVMPTAQTTPATIGATDPTAAPDMQVSQTQVARENVSALHMPLPQDGLQIALFSIIVLLVAIVVWQFRRRTPTTTPAFEIIDAVANSMPNARAQPTEGAPHAGSHFDAPSTNRTGSDPDDEDTSTPEPTMDANFDDEATFIHTPQVDRRLVGRLIRVTSEPRFPAELPLLDAPLASFNDHTIAIGRHSKHNEVVISDKSVSRHHAVIVQRDEVLFIRDNASTAGTLVNWMRLQADAELPLHHQDILSFGEAVYEFRDCKEETDSLLPLTLKSTNEVTELIEK